ncbi:MAG: OFA family MFS transporter [Bacillota bacterium]
MAESRVPNRWFIVLAGIVIQLALGTVYAFSVFRNPLMAKFGWTVTQTTNAFTITLVFFTVAMIFAGRWQDRVGPRLVATVGGVLLGAGTLLASQTSSLMMLYLSYGVLGGLGIGFAYVTPIATIVKWFPDMRGLMTGLAVFGFGAGSLIFAPLAAKLIVAYGVLTTFAILGVIFLVAVTGSAQALQNPPAGWRPAGWNPPAPKPGAVVKSDYAPTEMLSTLPFWMLWVMYLFGAAAGLMVISQASPMGQEVAKLSKEAAAAAVGLLAIFNGAGRIGWGWVSDRLGRVYTLVAMFLVLAADMFLVLPRAASYGTFVIGIALAAFAFGGYLALLPALTADYFGTKNYGLNYGWMFTAYGAASIFGPGVIARVKEATGNYTAALYIYAALALIGVVLALLTRPPVPKAEATQATKAA